MTSWRTRDPGYRADLEGLRGVAILLVLLCHVRIPGADAGFVGVDVFFVLSGFLITGLLVDEHDRTGRIGLGSFYTRRARRILPAAGLVLATTLLAAPLVLSPLDFRRIADDGLAASLSLANVRYAVDATDYFAPVDTSPMLHFWSLAVEEQFYLVWPILLLSVARIGRPRLAMATLAIAVLAGSFVLSAKLTDTSGAWAYFSLPTRAWQLTAGGLLALGAPLLGRVPHVVAAAVGWLGAALLGASLVAIGPTTAYPGLASLLPTVGAVALIASGGVVGSPGWIVFARAPLRWLGRISYSLYLWHWPILVLGSVALGLGVAADEGGGDGLAIRVGLALLAVAIAAVTWRLVEEPLRRGRVTRWGRARGVALAGATALTLVVGSTAIGVVGDREVAAAAALDADAASTDESSPTAVLDDPVAVSSSMPQAEPQPPSTPSPTAVPAPSPSASIQPSAAPRPKPLIDGALPRDLRPSLARARQDTDTLRADGCGLSLAGSEPPACVYGDPAGATTVALVGDSHAAHWFPAIELLARQRGWRLVPYMKFSCVFVDMRIWSPRLKREYTECEAWRVRVVDRLVHLRPDLVIVASAQELPVVVDRDDDPELQGAALARLIKRIPGVVAIMVDTPRSVHDVPSCLARHPDAIERCTTTRSAAIGARYRIREAEAARLSGATLVDLSAVTCPTDPCPPVIGSMLVYRDHHHLTATFARSLVDQLGVALPVVGDGHGAGHAGPARRHRRTDWRSAPARTSETSSVGASL
ncbi:MAG TPA: acyltransferase family protein [Candidatus Limnocylindrales bacterium]|nr:acyltransferase family protein [Candidatus Limnocylindrales bacterium]